MSPLELPPDLRGRLRGLEITPRGRTVLAQAGAHASRNRGGGMEFAQYRAYERGDDLRRIDWRLYARSDKLFVRDAERESPVAVWLVIDASASMGQVDLRRPDWSRFDAARRMAAAIIDIALRQGDRFGVAVETVSGPVVITPGGGAGHRDRAFSALAGLAPGGAAAWGRDVAALGERFGRHDLIVLISDGMDEDLIQGAERLAATGRDVALIRVLTSDERDFPFDQGYRFVDPETGADLLGDGRALRDDFLTRFTAARAALDERLDACGVRHVEHFLDRPEDEALRALFSRRGGA
ncbi:DUF58 domain-containing protein [Brevundimonas sp.]|uniref:DUF58 domain-containing protein n=1 Tax=Brevundimonas sp. TaxID=1871086 RepID=UPI0035AEC798